jgi:probable F420-dependent oxidoreductase
MRMHLGAVFPTLEIGNDPGAIRSYVQAVEELGYHHILLLDHIVGFDRPDFVSAVGPFTHESPFHEIFVLLGYIAACTTRVELATGVLILPLRQTALVAKQAAEVDVLSGGRLRLGVGVGWVRPEFEALDADWQTRGRRCEEQIEVLRALWAEPVVTFDGRWHKLERAGINPKPVRGSIPIWLGGGAEATLRRVATHGDGWFPLGATDDETRERVDRLRTYVREAGRAVDDVGIEAILQVSKVPETACAGFAAGWRALGATHLSVETMAMGFTSVEEHLALLRRVMDIVEV